MIHKSHKDFFVFQAWLEKAAENGQMNAALTLARVLLTGRKGVARNPEVALPWLVTILDSPTADESMILESKALLGKCFMDGYGVAEKAPEEAEIYLKAAAVGGDVTGAFYYSQLLYSWRTSKEKQREAHDWLEAAALGGHGLACYYLGHDLEKNGKDPSDLYKQCVQILEGEIISHISLLLCIQVYN